MVASLIYITEPKTEKNKTRGQRCFTKHKLHTGRRNGRKMPIFVPGDFDIWPWHSNSSERGTKHAFPVNLAPRLSLLNCLSLVRITTFWF